MEGIKHMLVWVIRLVVTAGVILFTYTIVGNVLGTVIFVVGSIILLTVIISSFIGIVIGKSRLLKNSGRFELFQIITYSVAVGLILLNAWWANTVLKEEFGPLSATEKIGLIHNAFSSNENEISALTKDYPVLVTRHITFRYHPDTEKSVEGMIASLDAIEQLEIAIYGREIKKDKPLEVLIFKNADDYFELNRDVHSLESGHYDSNHKRAMVYKGGVSGMEDDLYVIETFVHEYSHYLLDLFLEQEDLKKYDGPVLSLIHI